jgi:hypothetical protein
VGERASHWVRLVQAVSGMEGRTYAGCVLSCGHVEEGGEQNYGNKASHLDIGWRNITEKWIWQVERNL